MPSDMEIDRPYLQSRGLCKQHSLLMLRYRLKLMTRGRSNQHIPLCSDNIVEHCGSKTEQLTADRITEASGLHYSDCLAELGLSSSQQ